MRWADAPWVGTRSTPPDRVVTALADPSGQAPRLRYSFAALRAVGSGPVNQQVGAVARPSNTTSPQARH